MDWEKLKKKYGKGKSKQLLNRAIRHEMPGGDETLDLLTHVAMLRRSKRFNANAMEALEGIEDRVQDVRDSMVKEIFAIYDKSNG